jgi:hypothetical protein
MEFAGLRRNNQRSRAIIKATCHATLDCHTTCFHEASALPHSEPSQKLSKHLPCTLKSSYYFIHALHTQAHHFRHFPINQ